MSGMSRLKKKLADMPSPCDGCSHADRCATGYACRAYSNWVVRGSISEVAAYIPRKAIYDRIFNQGDID